MATLVTALYDIGRDKLKGKHAQRSFTKYLNWFKHVLRINVPMVIFVPKELEYYVLEHRPKEYLSKIVIREFTELHAYKYHDQMQSIINNMVLEPEPNGTIPKYFAECPEFITAKYETIIFSKFDFLQEVAQENPHNTKYFIWLDAGTFYDTPLFDYTLPWPDPYKIQMLGDQFLLSDHDFNIKDKSPLKDKRAYLRRNSNNICAFVLGGTKVAIDRVHTQFWNEVDNALKLGVINNEQHILQLMVLEQPDYYHLWHRTRYSYSQYSAPLKDRMIPVELAHGTKMFEPYPINTQVKVLTVATKEVTPSVYERWEISAKHFGYNYELLGTKQAWKGFGTKIELYRERLQSVTEPYTLLCDCTDLFFCGPAIELLDKFTIAQKEIVVGGELELYYPNGKHHVHTIKSFFEANKKSPQCFPNSGFIFGKTHLVKKLMDLHLGYSDNQAACFDTIFENKMTLNIDYDTEFVGNIPNYKERNSKAIHYFEFKNGRYTNKISGATPIALHFPGKNWHTMHEFYSKCNIVDASTSTTTNSWWIIIIILIIVLILWIMTLFYN